MFDYVKIYQYKKQHAITTLINNKIDKITGEKKSKSVNKPKKRKDFLVQFKKYSVKQILSLPWVCRKMHLKIKIASEDAAETAIFYGVVHTIKSVLYQELLKRIKFKAQPEFLIIPDFDGKEKEFLFKCIISIKIGNVIHILKNSI